MQHLKIINKESLRPSLKPNIKKRPLQPSKVLNTSVMTYSENQTALKHNRYIDRHNSFDYCNQKSVNKTAQNQTLLTDIYFHRDYNDLASSYSFQAQQGYQIQKKIFCKFLQSQCENWIQFIHQMNQIDWQNTNIVEFVKIGRTQIQVYQNRKLAHFIGIWLLSMKYKENQTKVRIVENVKLFFSKYQSGPQQIAQQLYDNLMRKILPTDLQLKVLLETCRRGWEYFSFSICKLIRILSKVQKIEDSELYEQMCNVVKS